jgi:N-acetylmuramoyl-L-alanine amidase
MIRRAAVGLLAAVFATAAALGVAQAAQAVATPVAAAAGVGVAAASPASVSAVVPTTPPVAAAQATASDARVVGDASRTRFVLDLSNAVQPSVFLLADPYRLIIDLAQVRFALPPSTGQSGRGLIAAFRYGLFSPGKSRIVVDLTGPVSVAQSYVTSATADQPARLVVEVVPATRAAFLAAVAASRSSADATVAPVLANPVVSPPDSRHVVVLDPGHGGVDLGAIGKAGTQEKDVALAFAKVLAAKLTATGRYDVYLTRTDDSFVSLGDRVTFAQDHRADLLISIHANSYSSSAVRGAAIYTFCEQMCDTDASRMALSENQSDALAGIDVAAEDSHQVRDILTDLTRRETLNFAQVFAQSMVKELKNADTGLFKEPHQEANFKVLTAADVPSALVELGFITSPADEKLLNSPDWQASTADAMVRGVGDFFADRLAPAGGTAEIVAQTPQPSR